MSKLLSPRGRQRSSKIIVCILICLFSLSPGLSQSTSDEVRFSPEDFKSVALRGVVLLQNTTTDGIDYYLIFAGDRAENDDPRASENQVKLGLSTLDVGLSLPNEMFWANLNPTQPDMIVDKELAETDVGRIMLEADFQMKKDFAEYQNPCKCEVGREYWELLGKKEEELTEDLLRQYPAELKNASNVDFSAAIRNWIVPGDIYAYENNGSFFIINSSLNISQEPAGNSSSYSLIDIDLSDLSAECLTSLNQSTKEYGNYSASLQKNMTLPLVVRDVNEKETYSDLRRVYTALAVAQWYKEHCEGEIPELGNLSGSREVMWSPEKVWQDYVVSFNEGEVECWQTLTWNNTTVTTYNLTYNNTYNVTRDYTYDLLYNSTTFSRSQGVFSDLNESSSTDREFEAYVDLGEEPLYESMQEIGYITSSESNIYTMGGVELSWILKNQKHASDLDYTVVDKIINEMKGSMLVDPGFMSCTSDGITGVRYWALPTASPFKIEITKTGSVSFNGGIIVSSWYYAILRPYHIAVQDGGLIWTIK